MVWTTVGMCRPLGLKLDGCCLLECSHFTGAGLAAGESSRVDAGCRGAGLCVLRVIPAGDEIGFLLDGRCRIKSTHYTRSHRATRVLIRTSVGGVSLRITCGADGDRELESASISNAISSVHLLQCRAELFTVWSVSAKRVIKRA